MGNYFKKSICMLLVFIMSLSPVAENIKIVYANQIVDNQEQIEEDKTNTEDNATSDEEEQVNKEENTEETNTEDEEEVIEEELDNQEPIQNSMQIEQADATTIEISTVQELKDISKNLSGNYVLMNDIDLNNEEWMPIGNRLNAFTGTFDGNGYKIKKLSIYAKSSYQGLFGYIKYASIKNVVLEDASIYTYYYDYSGAITGKAEYSTIENCAVIGDGSLSSYDNYYIGGIVGYADNTIINQCYTEINVISSNGSKTGRAGGIVGHAQYNTILKNCFSKSYVTGSGALVGYSNSSTNKIENSYFNGNLNNSSTVLGSNLSQINSYILGFSKTDFEGDTLGIIKTYDQLKDIDTFKDWDFENVWELDKSINYPPILRSLKESIGTTKGRDKSTIQISTVEEFKNIENDLNANYILVNDIDLNNEEWAPLGSDTQPFTGTFNGNNYKIKNLSINDKKSYRGLFGYVKYAYINNLVVENVNINSYDYLGTIVAKADYSTIESCAVIGEGGITSSKFYTGGIVGYANFTTIDQCYTNIDIISTNKYAGGIVGYANYYTVLKNSFSTSNVQGDGALIGYCYSYSTNKIENSYFIGRLINKFTLLCFNLLPTNSYILGYFETDFENNELGIVKTDEQLKDIDNFTGWNFQDVWEIDEYTNYPVLRNLKEVIGSVNGRHKEPIKISTVEDLKNIEKKLSESYILVNDIDLNNEDWLSIGNSLYPFSGKLDGNGYKIKNLNIKAKSSYQGIFGYTKYANIKNLVIENVDINSNDYLGVITARDEYSIIENCAVIGEGSIVGYNYIGGIVGYTDRTVINQCYTDIDITSAGNYVGSMVGYANLDTTLKNSFSQSNITGSGSLVGYSNSSSNKIENSYFAGTMPNKKLALCSNGIDIVSSYFNLDNAHNGNYTQGSQAKTTEQLKQQSTYENWDFVKVWYFVEDYDYPLLQSMKVLPNGKEITTNIPKVPNFRYELYPTSVMLKWDDNTTDTFSHFSIEQKDSLNGNYVGIATTNTKLGYEVKNILPDKEYWFRVCVYDKSGNRGEYAELHVTTSKDTSKPIINSIEPASNWFNATIPMVLKASDNGTIKEIIVEISTSKDSEFTNLLTKTINPPTSSITEKLDIDTTKLVEGVHYVNVKIKDNEGNETKQQIPYYVDRTKPNTPSGLNVEVASSYLNIIWSEQVDTQYFTLYRKDESNTDFVIYKDNLKTLNYIDENVVIGKTYVYKVKATDLAGNESDISEVVMGVPIEDKISPRIVSIYPNNSSILGKNAYISVLASDDNSLSKIVLEYKNKSSYDWEIIEEKQATSKANVAKFDLDTSKFNSEIYDFRSYAEDSSKNKSDIKEFSYTFNLTAPNISNLTMTAKGWELELNWNVSDLSNVAKFNVYKKQNDGEYKFVKSTTETKFNDLDVNPSSSYYYKVEVVDKYFNTSTSSDISGTPTNEDKIAPVAQIMSSSVVIINDELVLDGTLSTDNDKIASYFWEFGDGSTSTEPIPTHTFDSVGITNVSLTVEDESGNKNKDSIAINVLSEDTKGTKVVFRSGVDGSVIPNVMVYLKKGYSYETFLPKHNDGIVDLDYEAGEHEIKVYAEGYLPKTEKIIIGEDDIKEFYLDKSELTISALEVKRLTLSEIEFEGIDVNAPENQHVFEFSFTVDFDEYQIVKNGYINGSGEVLKDPSGSIGRIGDYNYYITPEVTPERPDLPPRLGILVVPGKISWLKEMFYVKYYVVNLAPEEFALANSEATLYLPDGLSLAKMTHGKQNDLTQQLGRIDGQSGEETTWYIKGDKEGQYDLSVEFKSTLHPFGIPIQSTVSTTESIDIRGGQDLHLYIVAEDSAYTGEKYYVDFALINTGNYPIYNVSTSFGSPKSRKTKTVLVVYDDSNGKVLRGEGRDENGRLIKPLEFLRNNAGYIPKMYAGDKGVIKELGPGEIVYGTYVEEEVNWKGEDWNDENGGQSYFKYIAENAFVVKRSDGVNIDSTVEFMPSHIVYFNINADMKTIKADPVDAKIGAFLVSLPTYSTVGSTELTLDLNYNSRSIAAANTLSKLKGIEYFKHKFNQTQHGEVGRGWNHNFETKLVSNDDGTISVKWTPYSSTIFEPVYNDEALKDEYFEEISVVKEENGVYELPDKPQIKSNKFRSTDISREDYTIEIVNDEYVLTYDNYEKIYFDKDGNTTKIVRKNGSQLNFTRPNKNQLIVTEVSTGQKLIINYNAEGLIESVTDGNGTESRYEYNANKDLVKILLPDGSVSNFTYDENGLLLTETDGTNTYVKNTYDDKGRVISQDDSISTNGLTYFEYGRTEIGEDTTTITDRNGNKEVQVYDFRGNLKSETDKLGNTTKYEYNENSKRTKTTYQDGSFTLNKYDERDNLIEITDQEGIKTFMEYDKNDNLIKITNELGETITQQFNDKDELIKKTVQSGLETTYEYNEFGQMTKQQDGSLNPVTYSYTNGKLTESDDGSGNKTKMTYTPRGVIDSIENASGSKVITETDALNRAIKMTDAMSNVYSKSYDGRGNVVSETDPKGNTTYSTYDGNRNLKVITNALNQKTYFDYDGEDRLIKVTNNLGESTSFELDANGNTIKTVDNEGNVTKYTYNYRGQVTSATNPNGGTGYFEYYKNGALKKSTTISGVSINYEYDRAGRLIKETTSNGAVTQYTYDSVGNRSSLTNALGQSAYYTYDQYGNTTSITDFNGNKTEYAYNDKQQLSTVKDALGNVTTYYYNVEGRLSGQKNARGFERKYFYDALGRMTKVINEVGSETTVHYDSLGNIIKITDALGVDIQNYTYDAIGRVTEVEDALNNKTQSKYDEANRLVEAIDELNNSTKFSYDKLGRLTKVTDPMLGESSQQFDAEGNLTKLTDPNGNVSTYVYNQVGQLLEETSPIGTKSYKYNSQDLLEEMTNGRGDKRTLRYDLLGRITEFEDDDGKVTYKYDNNNNVIEVTSKEGTVKREFDALNRVIKHVDTRGNVIGYQYNEVGSLSKLIYPDGKYVTYVYNGAEMLEKVTDWAGRVTLYEYDKNGRLYKTKRSNGTVEETQFDKAGRILSRIDKTSDGKEINTFVYEYDDAGKVTVEKGIANPNVPSIKNVKMEYAPGNKLISYNGKEVKYDSDGNMIYGPLNDQMVTFVYDSRNRLVKAGNTTYTYDGENTRVSVTELGKTTTYITDPNARLSRILAKQTSDGKQIFYVYGNGLIGQEESGKFKTYHYDLRGSTTKVTDETGKITDTIAYGPYGELLSKEGTTDLEFLYNGRDGVQTDSNGLYYMRARYYNTDIKRFINQDILIGSITNGKSLNRYAYVHGDPVSLVDPFGLAPNPWGVVSMFTHIGLAIIGMIPGPIGVVADLFDATLYLFEGDYLSAAQSALNSAMPFVPCNFKDAAYVAGAALDLFQADLCFKDGNILGGILNVAGASIKANNALNYSSGKWSACFTAGTLVLVEDGYKPIEDIEVGDYVYASNIETGEVELKEVLTVFEKESDSVYYITVEDEAIETTATHPFYVDGEGWVSASNLKVGDKLVDSNGDTLVIEKIEVEYFEDAVKVYNFEVDGFHNYFVSDENVLVHNAGKRTGCNLSPDDTSTNNKKTKKVSDNRNPKVTIPEGNRLTNSDEYLERVRDRTTTRVEHRASDSHSVRLRNELYDAGVHNAPYDNQAHHIVPWDHPDAEDARKILDDYGIEYDSAVNGVLLPNSNSNNFVGNTSIHSGTHTKQYIQNVTQRLQDAVNRGAKKDDIVNVLNDVRGDLLEGRLKLGK